MIQHFVLTRSNYSQPDLAFVHKRFELMRLLCASSLRDQTRRDFTWIVRFNSRSPLLKEAADLFRGMPFDVAAACEAPVGDSLFSNPYDWRDVIAARLHPDTTHILTTRLDDDDILSPTYIEQLRDKVEPSRRPVGYLFPAGYVLRLSDRMAARWSRLNNQFASLLSPVEDGKIVMDANHRFLTSLGPVQFINADPSFIWVRHADSITDGRKFRARLPMADLLKDFPCLENL